MEDHDSRESDTVLTEGTNSPIGTGMALDIYLRGRTTDVTVRGCLPLRSDHPHNQIRPPSALEDTGEESSGDEAARDHNYDGMAPGRSG